MGGAFKVKRISHQSDSARSFPRPLCIHPNSANPLRNFFLYFTFSGGSTLYDWSCWRLPNSFNYFSAIDLLWWVPRVPPNTFMGLLSSDTVLVGGVRCFGLRVLAMAKARTSAGRLCDLHSQSVNFIVVLKLSMSMFAFQQKLEVNAKATPSLSV